MKTRSKMLISCTSLLISGVIATGGATPAAATPDLRSAPGSASLAEPRGQALAAMSVAEPAGAEKPDGVKSWLVKKALQTIAGMIRTGGDKFVDLAGDWLDAEARKAIRGNSSQIANVIDDVANIPDIATYMVRSEIYNGLKGIVGPGTAQMIASAVEGVLWILL